MSDNWTDHSTRESDLNHADTWCEPNYHRHGEHLQRAGEGYALRWTAFQRPIYHESPRERERQQQRATSTGSARHSHVHEGADARLHRNPNGYFHIVHAIPTPPTHDVSVSPRTIPRGEQKMHFHVFYLDPTTTPSDTYTAPHHQTPQHLTRRQRAEAWVNEILTRTDRLYLATLAEHAAEARPSTEPLHHEDLRDDENLHRVSSDTGSLSTGDDDEPRCQCAGQDSRLLLERLRRDTEGLEKLARSHRARYEAARAEVEGSDAFGVRGGDVDGDGERRRSRRGERKGKGGVREV